MAQSIVAATLSGSFLVIVSGFAYWLDTRNSHRLCPIRGRNPTNMSE